MPLFDFDPLPSTALRPITVDDYHAMGQAGVFDSDERVELLDGCLLPMSPIGNAHIIVVNRLERFFARHLYREEGDVVHVSAQNSIRLDDQSEPEPDLVLLLPAYEEEMRHPSPTDALLLIEVSDSLLSKDRSVKRPRYAAAEIPEVWIVSLDGHYVEVAREPFDSKYASIERFSAGSSRPLVPQLLPDLPPLDLEALFSGLIV